MEEPEGGVPQEVSTSEVGAGVTTDVSDTPPPPGVTHTVPESKTTPGTLADAKEKDAEQSPAKQSGSGLTIKNRLVSFGFTSSSGTRAIDTVVVHSSYNSLDGDEFDVGKIIGIYKSYGVSAHYLVGRDGTAYRLVKENDVAWHAGVSEMKDGRTDVNGFSIGIEMVGTKDSGYTDAQYSALNALIKDIKSRHTIKYVVGHSDIAPGRKTDPWKLDWSRVKK